eukprot:GHVU01047096.1.p1 GENE.GHVU01047096.1~~GHVU01047096.1.p1  ORF type:complete len:102 (-),score=1.57 GHVU01047096.1:114-419(-)
MSSMQNYVAEGIDRLIRKVCMYVHVCAFTTTAACGLCKSDDRGRTCHRNSPPRPPPHFRRRGSDDPTVSHDVYLIATRLNCRQMIVSILCSGILPLYDCNA